MIATFLVSFFMVIIFFWKLSVSFSSSLNTNLNLYLCNSANSFLSLKNLVQLRHPESIIDFLPSISQHWKMAIDILGTNQHFCAHTEQNNSCEETSGCANWWYSICSVAKTNTPIRPSSRQGAVHWGNLFWKPYSSLRHRFISRCLSPALWRGPMSNQRKAICVFVFACSFIESDARTSLWRASILGCKFVWSLKFPQRHCTATKKANFDMCGRLYLHKA